MPGLGQEPVLGGEHVPGQGQRASSAVSRHAVVAIGLLGLALLVGLVVVAVTAATRSESAGTGAVLLPPASNLGVGSRAPIERPLARLGGGAAIDLERLAHGRPIVVNFFASWCPACTAELGALSRVWRSHHRQVLFVGVDTDDPYPAKARRLLAQAGVGYRIGVDNLSVPLTNAWGLANGLPATFFLDANGKIVIEVLGGESATVLDRRVQELLATQRATKRATQRAR